MHFHMINVGTKDSTARIAVAQGQITMSTQALLAVKEQKIPKGHVLALAEVAGILAAKKTPELIPLCHSLPLDSVHIRSSFISSTTIQVVCEVSCHGKTGVEMEALSGVWGALLTIYDLVKGTDPALTINDVMLCRKEGGKSGVWTHPQLFGKKSLEEKEKILINKKAFVLTVSDRCHRQEQDDCSGPALVESLHGMGCQVSKSIVPDEASLICESILSHTKSGGVDLIITTGGTGLGPRDVTIETLKPLFHKEVPGFGELLRKEGAAFTPYSWLSASCSGVINHTLVVCLPGSLKGAMEGIKILEPLLPHALKMIAGGAH